MTDPICVLLWLRALALAGPGVEGLEVPLDDLEELLEEWSVFRESRDLAW